MGDPDRYLRATPCLDADHPAVRAFAQDAAAGAADPVERSVRLYYAVRDGLRYDPYGIEVTVQGLAASRVLARGRGFCVAKAGVLAAAARALGIPSRLRFADVCNHLATERLRALMGTDVFHYHGCTELLLDGRWVKATPAFNIELCRRFGVAPLEFDGRTDAIFQPFDERGHRHMEYVRDHGTRDDMPVDELREALARHYPQLRVGAAEGDLEAERIAEESSRR